MKFGVRKPSLKKSVKARTTGKLKRKAKSSVNPLYGKKGVGMIKNPKRSVYNKVYKKTTIGVNPLSASSSSTLSKKSTAHNQTTATGYTKTETIEKEVEVTNPLERWVRKLLGKESIDRKIVRETVITEQYTYQEVEEVKAKAEESISLFKQSLRYTNETVNTDVFFSNLTEAEESISKAASLIRRYSFLVSEENNVIEAYHQFISQKDAMIKQFLHRHFQACVESASQLKTEQGKRKRLTANYNELTEQFHLLSTDSIETVNTIWSNVLSENIVKEC